MNLARADGGRLRLNHASDLRLVARIVADELSRTVDGRRMQLVLQPEPVMSDLDPDVFAILYRNLVENALRHGEPGTPIQVSLSRDGVLTVSNEGPIVPKEVLSRLIASNVRVHTRRGAALGWRLFRPLLSALAMR